MSHRGVQYHSRVSGTSRVRTLPSTGSPSCRGIRAAPDSGRRSTRGRRDARGFSEVRAVHRRRACRASRLRFLLPVACGIARSRGRQSVCARVLSRGPPSAGLASRRGDAAAHASPDHPLALLACGRAPVPRGPVAMVVRLARGLPRLRAGPGSAPDARSVRFRTARGACGRRVSARAQQPDLGSGQRHSVARPDRVRKGLVARSSARRGPRAQPRCVQAADVRALSGGGGPGGDQTREGQVARRPRMWRPGSGVRIVPVEPGLVPLVPRVRPRVHASLFPHLRRVGRADARVRIRGDLRTPSPPSRGRPGCAPPYRAVRLLASDALVPSGSPFRDHLSLRMESLVRGSRSCPVDVPSRRSRSGHRTRADLRPGSARRVQSAGDTRVQYPWALLPIALFAANLAIMRPSPASRAS